MTETEQLLDSLNHRGITLWAQGEQLGYEGPEEALTSELLDRLQAHKADILSYLRQSEAASDIAPIPRLPAGCVLPMSFAQERLWFLDQLEGPSPTYNIPLLLQLQGRVSVTALRHSLKTLVTRHASLRMYFPTTADQPRVELLAPYESLEIVDLSELTHEEQDLEVQQHIQAHSQRLFDLTQGPLFSAQLLIQRETLHTLLINVHHIVADGWSLGVLVRELGILYQACCDGLEPELPALPIQYPDYAYWERQWLTEERLEEQLTYWQRQLQNAPELLELPCDYPRPARQSYRGEHYTQILSPALVNNLKRLSQTHHSTLFMTLLAAFNVLLHRYSGQTDLCIGSPVAHRVHPQGEALIGFFVNDLVLRTRLQPTQSFRTLLEEVRHICVEAYKHQDIPFAYLVDKLRPKRSLSYNPLFQVLFVLQNLRLEGHELPDLHLIPRPHDTATAKFDFSLSMIEVEGSLECSWEYASDLFKSTTIKRMASHFQILLEAIVADPDRAVAAYPLLTDAEQHTLLYDWNATHTDYPAAASVVALFEAQVEKTPDATAVVFEDHALTYGELNRRANQLAHHLRRLGVGPEVLVALCLERSLEMVVALLGILKAGGAYVPLDPAYPPQRLAFMLEDTRAPVLLTQEALREALPVNSAEVVWLDRDWHRIANLSTENPIHQTQPQQLAYTLYTSGSTGRPKGIAVPHRAVLRLVKNTTFARLDAEQTWLLLAPIAFDASTLELWASLLNGARLVIMPPGPVDLAALGQVIRRYQITSLWLTAGLFHQMVDQRLADLAPLQQLLAGGDVLSVDHVHRVLMAHPQLTLINGYGPTENTTFTCCQPMMVNRLPTDNTVPIGRPIANTRVYLLDAHGQPVPVGVPGEVYTGGDGLARGYLHHPVLTAERFVPDPFSDIPGERLYCTGDLARYRPDGSIEFLGRLDHQVKLRGFRIELGEIEAVLSEAPPVAQAVVSVHATPVGEPQLVGYVVPRVDTAVQAVAAEHIDQWQTLFEDAYQASGKQDTDFAGWNSSYTGAAIPKVEMSEWTEQTVAAIRRLNPQRVLEVGCGTGLLLTRLAPVCEEYWGTDFEPQVLARLQAWLDGRPGYSQVRLQPGEADCWVGIPQGHFDTIILNSVVQYFPTLDYLLRVLEPAIAAVREGGRVFVGDVRSLPLQSAYHRSVQFYQAPAELSVKVLTQRLTQQGQRDEELLLDPRLFFALQQRLPRLTGVSVHVKRGHTHNELTRFRYDVVLEVGSAASAVLPEEQLAWTPAWTLEAIAARLEQQPPTSLQLRGVANARLATETTLGRWLAEETKASATVGELRKALATEPATALDPEALAQLGESHGYRVWLSPLAADREGRFDALFWMPETARPALAPPPTEPEALSRYVNRPLQDRLVRQMVPALRQHLQARLPEYMVPSHLIVLEALPLTPNGKVDRRALPAPGILDHGDYVAPRTPEEDILATLWAEVLGIERVGIHDNFFELGGHSLLATRLVLRIREAFDLDLPLRELFDAPIVADLILRIESLRRASGEGNQSLFSLPTIIPAPAERHQPFPLNDVQQAYWLGRSDVFALGNVAPHIYLELDCPLFDIERLNQAWQQLIDRHEMLRAVVLPNGQQQILETAPSYRIPLLDLQGEASETIAQLLSDIRQQMVDRVFNVAQWPLFELRATQWNARTMRLHFSLDAIISDGWSIAILSREWWQLYQNPDRALTPLTLSFRDYVIAEQAWQQREGYQHSLAYWLDRLDRLPPAPQLPLARQPESLAKPRFSARQFQLDRGQWQTLKQKATRASITPSALLLAAFADVLALWSKQPHFTLNLTLFNRLPVHEQINQVMGDFTSLVLLEVNNRQPASFTERARRLQKQLWHDLEHRYVSGVRVMREMAARRKAQGGAMMPIVFTSMLALEFDQRESLFSELGEPVFGLGITPQVWLDHGVVEGPAGLQLLWNSVDELFPEGLLDNMFAAYCGHIEQLTTTESAWQTDSTHALLPAPHRKLYQAVNTTAAPGSDRLLHSYFLEQVASRAAQPAVITPALTLSYAQLHAQALQIAQWLRWQGAQRNTLVAVAMEKGWEQVVAVMGILFSGAAYLPIDPELPEERQHFLLEEGEVTLALTQAKLALQLRWPDTVRYLSVDAHDLPPGNTLPPVPGQSPSDLAYVIYTSGSTGQPKGVAIDHRGAVNTLLDINRRFTVTGQDRVLALSALNFDLSVYDIFGLLAAGGSLVIPDAERRRDPQHWTELMIGHGVTVWNTVPALMQMLVDYQNSAAVAAPLRLVMMSGDWIPLTLPERIKQLWPNSQVISLGGATEAAIWSIYYPIVSVDPNWRSVPYGKPLDNQTFQVLNEWLEPCPLWVPGQLYIGGIGLAQGYWKDAAKTQASFITHPRTGERLYKTGDLGRWLPEGNIEFLGREDWQVKVRGHRIELGEIEAYLNRHPRLKAGVVMAVGEAMQEKQLVAYLVAKTAAPPQPVDQAAYGTEAMQGILTDPAERAAFKLRQPGIRRFAEAEQVSRQTLELPSVTLNPNAYLARQSYRRFEQQPLPLEALSALLACLQPMTFPQAILPKYRYGSAGSLYPIQCYLYLKANRVAGVAAGVYYYQPLEHRLILLTTEAPIDRTLHGGINHTIFDQSAFSLFLVSDMAAIEPMYGQMSRDFCLLEAGYISQLLMEEAPQHDLGLCPIGGMQFEPLRPLFELSDAQEMLHSFLGGAISVEQKRTLPTLTHDRENGGLVADAAATELEEGVKVFLGQHLPGHMVPHRYLVLNQLPLTENGKVNRTALPIPDLRPVSRHQEAPANELEQRLREIIGSVLGLEAVGVTDNFFDLGANSLDLIQLYNEIKTQLGVEIEIIELFRRATIRGIAEWLMSRDDSQHYEEGEL